MRRRQLAKMAQRMVKRAGIEGEQGIAVAFGYNSLFAAIFLAVLEELGVIGDVASILLFGLHRIVLVTDKQTYLFRAKPFHRPGEVLGTYPIGPDAVTRSGAKLTFSDGKHVWHSPLFASRVKLVAETATAQRIEAETTLA